MKRTSECVIEIVYYQQTTRIYQQSSKILYLLLEKNGM